MAIEGATTMGVLMAIDSATAIDSEMVINAGRRWTADGTTAINR